MALFILTDLYACFAALLLFVLILAAKYHNRCIGTIDRPDLPGPRGLPLIGNMLLVFKHKDGMLKFLALMEDCYGPLFTFTMPNWGRNIVVNRPEWLEHIRKRDTTIYAKGEVVRDVFSQFPGSRTPISTDGAAWRSARKMMQPIFGAKSVNTHASKAMAEIVPVVKTMLKSACQQNIQIDWNNMSARLALSIFCKMAFDMSTNMLTTDLSCLSESNVIADSLGIVSTISAERLFNPAWRITELFDGTRARFARARKQLDDIVDELIAERTVGSKAGQSTDYLAALLEDIADSEQEIGAIRDTLMTLLFAGRDSTQNTISWAMYEILRKPEWVRLMQTEADAAARSFEPGQTIPSYSQMHLYPITMAVCFETLRLWPGLPKNARVATDDDVLPAIPEHNLPAVRVNKGDFVLWSDMGMMRNEDVWGPDAKEFNPRRHLDVNGVFVKPATPRFHSFGSGPRSCPAMQLSTYEFTAIFAGLLKEFDFVPVNPGVRTSVDAFAPFMDGPNYLHVLVRGATKAKN